MGCLVFLVVLDVAVFVLPFHFPLLSFLLFFFVFRFWGIRDCFLLSCPCLVLGACISVFFLSFLGVHSPFALSSFSSDLVWFTFNFFLIFLDKKTDDAISFSENPIDRVARLSAKI